MATMLMKSARARGWVVLAGLLILAVAILWGLVIFIWSVLAGTGPGSGSGGRTAVRPSITATSLPSVPSLPSLSAEAGLRSAEDALAASPMLQIAPAAALPQVIASSTTTAPPLTLPLPPPTNTTGTVPTGYPRTPEGAVAQLAAIDALALKDLNPVNSRAAYDWAALPGAVPFEQWTPQVGVSAILTSAGAPNGSTELTSTWVLTHAQVKGVLDGGNFVVACVLGEFDANYRASVRAGVGDCQRMVWNAGGWRIGPGAQPAFAPSTWPGSAQCVLAGWLEVPNA